MCSLRTGGNGNWVGGPSTGDPSRSVSAAGMLLTFFEKEFRTRVETRRYVNCFDIV